MMDAGLRAARFDERWTYAVAALPRLEAKMDVRFDKIDRCFEEMEDRLNAMRDGIDVNFVGADRAIDAANRNEQGLRDLRRAMQRMQIRLDNLEDKT